jgi:hypothetical protein
LRFRGWADDGMKCFILGGRADAEGAIRQFDQFVFAHNYIDYVAADVRRL